MRCPLALAALLTAALAAAACGERSEPTGPVPASYPVTVIGAGDAPTRLGRQPERIVALDAGSAELLDAIGAGDRVVGAPSGVTLGGGNNPEDVVRETGEVDVEAVLRLSPDLVVATPDTDPVERLQVQQRSQAAVYIQPARTVDDVVRATFELGELVGMPVEARTLANELRDQLAELESRLADAPIVTVFVDTGLFVTLGESSIFGDLLRRAKGDNVAPDPALGPISADELARADPAVYLVTSDSRLTLDALQRKPETKGLTAIREGRFFVLPLELVTRAGPSVVDALRQLAVDLHPDAFR